MVVEDNKSACFKQVEIGLVVVVAKVVAVDNKTTYKYKWVGIGLVVIVAKVLADNKSAIHVV